MSQSPSAVRGRHCSEVPRYAAIAAALRQEIGTGRWSAGDRLPAITELATRFETTPVTARQAVKLLETRGAVECRRGSGTFVMGSPLALKSLPLSADMKAIAAAIEQGVTTEIGPLDAHQHPDNIPAGLQPAPAYDRFCRLAFREGQPFMVSDVFLDSRIIQEHRQDFASGVILPRLLRLPGLDIRRATQVLTIDMTNPVVAAHLRLPASAAVARLSVALRDRAGTAVYVGALFWPADVVRVEFAV